MAGSSGCAEVKVSHHHQHLHHCHHHCHHSHFHHQHIHQPWITTRLTRLGTRVSMMLSALTYTLYMSQVLDRKWQVQNENWTLPHMHVHDISTAAVIPQQLLNLRGLRSPGSWWSDHLDRSGDKAVDNDRDHVNCSGHIPRQQLKARDHHQVTNRTTYVSM